MEYVIETRKSAKKNAINALMRWLLRDLKLEKNKGFIQVILTDTKQLGEVSEIAKGYYVIVLQKKLTLTQTLQTLCHEMVHVKQYAKGLLTNCPETGDFIWCGMHFSRKTDYYEQPWEVQAFSREVLLFRRATEFFTKSRG